MTALGWIAGYLALALALGVIVGGWLAHCAELDEFDDDYD